MLEEKGRKNKDEDQSGKNERDTGDERAESTADA
jgi:hypothetical protein